MREKRKNKKKARKFLLAALLFAVPAVLLRVYSGFDIAACLAFFMCVMLSSAFLCTSLSNRAKHHGGIIKALTAVFCVCIMLYMSAYGFIYCIAPRFLFHEQFNESEYSALVNDSRAESISFVSKQGTAFGWMLHLAADLSPLVVYYCGNAEDSSIRMKQILDTPELLEAFFGCNIICADYPGYGRSEGTISEKSLLESGLALYDYAVSRSDVNRAEIIIAGYSLGSGIANYTASKRTCSGLVLLAPYANGVDLFNNVADIFYLQLKYLVPFDMEADKFAADISVLPLIAASPDDEVIMYKSSLALSEKYPSGCEFKTVNGLKHNDFWYNPGVYALIKDYIQKTV